MIALPNALVNAGLIPGLILITLCALCSGYTGLQLSYNWTMLQKRSFIAVMICLTQFGFATVLILLAAKNTAILLHFFFSIKINFCWLIVIVGLIVWPATMLRSPMHFWQVAVFSALSSSIAVCLLVIGFVHDAPVCGQDTSYRAFDLRNFFMAYGTMVFAFGGHAVFPTIQNDMRKPHLFTRSVWVAYVLIVTYYVVISVMGYSIYGASVGDAIIPSVQLQWVQQTVNLMIALHVITTIVIVFSPLTQQVEEILRIPHHFGWQRFLVRSVLFWTVIFVALSLPNFGPLLDLIGASTMSVMTMIMPSIFYLFLCASNNKRKTLIKEGNRPADAPDNEGATFKDILNYVPRRVLVVNIFSLAFGIIGGLAATGFSIVALSSTDVAAPCYVQYIRQGGLPFVASRDGTVNCCGTFQNITVSGNSPTGYCSAFRPT
uniref:Aa_trans domain-containing protein n=1 Tax=Haemonchus contortus TaxID=6289 RepID=A0A7I4YRL9_HAECO